MREAERRRRYQDRNVTTQAPSKLIGYVSAGGVECPGEQRARTRNKPAGVRTVWLIAALLLLIWITHRGV